MKPILQNTSLKVRDKCADAAIDHIDHVIRIVEDPSSAANQLRAWDLLAKYGLAGRKAVFVENDAIGAAMVMAAREVFQPTEAQLDQFRDLLIAKLREIEAAALDPDEITEDEDPVDDD